MNLAKFKWILSLTLLAFILHSIEEYQTKLFAVDSFIQATSKYFSINPVSVFFLIQGFALLIFLGLLLTVVHNKLNKPLAIILGIVFIFELTHLYSAFVAKGYYPGLYSGIILIIIGGFYWVELFKQML